MTAQSKPTDPPGRRLRLTTVGGCRRELAVVYAEARQGRGLDWQSAARAASVLQILIRMIEADTFEGRIAALEAAAAEHRPNGRPNGHGQHARL